MCVTFIALFRKIASTVSLRRLILTVGFSRIQFMLKFTSAAWQNAGTEVDFYDPLPANTWKQFIVTFAQLGVGGMYVCMCVCMFVLFSIIMVGTAHVIIKVLTQHLQNAHTWTYSACCYLHSKQHRGISMARAPSCAEGHLLGRYKPCFNDTCYRSGASGIRPICLESGN